MKLRALIIGTVLIAHALSAQQSKDTPPPQTISVSGGKATFTNPPGSGTITLEYILTSGVSSPSINVQGCGVGGTCTTLTAVSGANPYVTAANGMVTFTGGYYQYVVTATYAGTGQVQVSFVGIQSKLGGGGSGGGGFSTLTTTGTSGPATASGTTLNIPVYSGGVTPASVNGVRYSSGSATTDTAATSPQLVTALNLTPSSTIAPALVPTLAATKVSGFGTSAPASTSGITNPQLVGRLTSRNLVCEGDSRVFGFGLTTPSTQNPCYQLSNLSTYSGRVLQLSNNAVSGSTITTLLQRYTATDHPLSPSVTGVPADLLIQIGINSVGGTGSALYVSGTTGLVGGSGYTNGAVGCTVSGGGVTAPQGLATCTATASGGAVTSVTIPPFGGGEAYVSTATITLAAPPSGTTATVTAVMSNMTPAVVAGLLNNLLTTKVQPDGWTRVIIGTVFPSGAILANSTFRASWEGLNEAIRATQAAGLSTIVVDDASILPDPYDSDLMQSGSLHANLAGATREANSYNDAIWGEGLRWQTPVPQLNARTAFTGTGNWRCDPYNMNTSSTASNNTICGMATAPLYAGNGASIYGARTATASTGGNLPSIVGDNNFPIATTISAESIIGEGNFQSATNAPFNSGVGQGSGIGCVTCSHNSFLGDTITFGSATSYESVVGSGATGSGSNTVTLGRSLDTVYIPSGKVATPTSFPQVILSGTAPTMAPGAAAGTSPTCTTVTGSNMAGNISCTTGTSTTTGILFSITWNGTVATAPQGCKLTPTNAASAPLSTALFQSNISTTGYSFSTVTPLAASTTYTWYTSCI